MSNKILSLYVTQVRCVDETEHEGVWPFQGEGVANDAIRLSATITSKRGSSPEVQEEIPTFNLGDNYQDGTVVNMNQRLFSVHLSSDSDYPFAVNAILVLGEEDWGGNFDNQVKNIINQIGNEARNAVSAAVASAVGGAIGSAFGPIGSLIGAGAGAAAGLLVNLAITGVQSLESDVWPPNDISFIIDRNAQSIIHTLPPIVFGRRAGFRDLGGTYELTCEWRLEAAAPTPALIALRAYNGQYVCAENGGGRELVANRNWIAEWETFEIIRHDSNRISLKAYNGQYVCAENGGGRELVANRDWIAEWETFEIIHHDSNRISLKAYNGQYVCAENGGGHNVVVNRNAIGLWEIFELIAR